MDSEKSVEEKMENIENSVEKIAKIATKERMDFQTKATILKTLIICACIVLCVGTYFLGDAIRYQADKHAESVRAALDYAESLIVEYDKKEEIFQDSVEGGNNYYQSGDNNKVGAE